MRRALLTLLVIAWCAPPAWAQDAAPVTLTPEDAIARAMAHSQRLAEVEARKDGARAAIDSSLSAKGPSLGISAGYTRTNNIDPFAIPQPGGALLVVYPDIPSNYFTRLMLDWPIYTSGRADALIRAARAEALAAEADIRVARADLRLEVVRAYWALVTATEAARVLDDALARADAHLADVRSRFENGLIPPNEVASVEAERARQQMHLIEARNRRASVHEDLRRLTGITGDIVVQGFSGSSQGFSTRVPTGVLPDGSAIGSPRTGSPAGSPGAGSPRTGSPAGSPGGSPSGSLVRPELEALGAQAVAADERVEAVQAGRGPTVSFTMGADYASPNTRFFPRTDDWRVSWQFGVVAAWTLWDDGRVAAQSAEAAAAARALRARHADLSALFSTEVRQRRLDLDSAYAVLDAANVGVQSATEARRIVSERFTVGVATSTEVLDAQVALLQAELDRTNALASIRLAEARLHRAEGLEP